MTDNILNFEIYSGYNSIKPDLFLFLDLMNEQAKEMGLTNTHFMNPHGLNNVKNYSNCEDLMKLSLEAMKLPKFREVVKAIEYTGKFMKKKIIIVGKANTKENKDLIFDERQINNKRKEILKSIHDEKMKNEMKNIILKGNYNYLIKK